MSFTVAMPVWAQILLDTPISSECAPAVSSTLAKSAKPCLLLLAHGSKDPRWREPFERLFLEARRDSESLKLAYMEFTGPTLLDVADECAREHVNCIRVLPLFMASGAHLATDVPAMLEQVHERYPNLKIELLPPAGEDPRLVSVMRAIIQEQLQRV